MKENGLDFLFMSVHDPKYEGSDVIWKNKIEALKNYLKYDVPVWLMQTMDDVKQLDSTNEILAEYKRCIFRLTVRTAKPRGHYSTTRQLFLSDMLKYLNKENTDRKGSHPFNRQIVLQGRKVKVSSWVSDLKVIDPLDSKYIISDDTFTTFHRGLVKDMILLKKSQARVEVHA